MTAKKKVAKKKTTPKKKAAPPLPPPDMAWFTRDRLGMFIHWGLYAMAARHEWVKSNERIPDAEYDKYFDLFNPDLYDPARWAKAAKAAGMKYFVITTKHHEGFCLWDSKHTDYKVTNTPYGKDLLGPMVDAFRAEGLGVGFYHSLIDWHHPDFTVEGDAFHPMRDDKAFLKKSKKRDMRKYAKYLHAQVRELLTEFGKIDYLFFDFSYPHMSGPLKGCKGWQSEKLMRMCRELQPGIIIDDRLDLSDRPGGWDVKTPEQFVSREWVTVDGKRVPWETCQTFSGSWGYHREEASWKSVEQLLVLLIDSVSKGGNLLLNVGPTARGTFDDRALDCLSGMGEWMRLHDRAITGCTQAPAKFQTPDNCLLTYNPDTKRLYLHILQWPITHLPLDGFGGGKVKYAQLLNDASEVQTEGILPWGKKPGKDAPPDLMLHLPVQKPDVAVPVVELFLR